MREVLRDRSIDWRNPTERARGLERMRAIENREMEKAREIARAKGKPERERLPDGRLRVLAGIDDDGELLYYVDRNDQAAISTAADKLPIAPFFVDGSGVRVGVWENGSPRRSHVEFNDGASSRINLVNTTSYERHATHVAGTIAAFGVNARAKGMANQAIIDAYTTGNDRNEMGAAGATGPGQHATKIYVSNHSYGYTYGWRFVNSWTWSETGTDADAYDPDFGQYSSTSAAFDGIHYITPYLLAFWAAGNENTDGPAPGEKFVINGLSRYYDPAIHPGTDGAYSGGFDTLGDHTTAKNLVVVGAVRDAVKDGQRDPSEATRANFSSTGPCDDGRIKPDLMGNGVSLYSTDSGGDNDYVSLQGTSMATPNLCGTAALLVDLYRELFSGDAMRSSTLKGLLIHTATDLGNPGPDYTYGWGLVDAEKAGQLLLQQADFPDLKSVIEDQVSPVQPVQSYAFAWDGASEIRATLCWTDPPGSSENTHNDRTPDLVNDLNLKLIAPDDTEYFPFVMPFVGTWTVESMSEPATTGVNHVDNVEQVLLESPGQLGVWQAEVSYVGSLTDDRQEYGLLISGANPAGTLVFNEDDIVVDEDAGTVSITVNRVSGKSGAVSVDYSTREGTAIEGSDYVATSGTLNWADGEDGPKSFSLSIVDDETSETYEETLSIELTNPTGDITIGGGRSSTVTIVDDEALIGLIHPNGAELFDTGSIYNITWVSSLGGQIRIDLLKNDLLYTTIADSTANDGLYEWDAPAYVSTGSNYRIRITSLAGGGEFDLSNHTFSVESAGNPETIGFSAATYLSSESNGPATITVNRNGSSAGMVQVDYAISNGTATAGEDYTATYGTLVWADGDDSAKTFNVSLIDDDAHEDYIETIQLSLTNTFGAAIADPNPAILQVQDDDNTPPSIDAGEDQIVEWSYTTPTPGLHYGTVEGNINLTAPNPKTQVLIDIASETENNIAGNTTEIYTGRFFDADGQVSFTEYIDDAAYIWIDDIPVLSDENYRNRTSTPNLNLTPGWHIFEIRISNGTGGSGPVGNEIGIGYDPEGGTAWQTLVDPGDGSLFQALLGIAGANSELAGTANDPDGDSLSVEWSVISGPGNVIFTDTEDLNTPLSFDALGQYELQLQVDDGRGAVTDRVIIDVVDSTPPALSGSDIVNDRAGADLTENDQVAYTLSFSEPLNAATLNPEDFGNAGTAEISIDSITAVSPSVFTVVVTPTSAGSLQLQILTGATVEDDHENALDTNSAIIDDTTITVNVRPPNNLPEFISPTMEGGDATENAAYFGTLAGKASDDDGDALSFAKVSGPSWLNVAADGTLTGRPADGDVGLNSFTVSVTDAKDPPVEATLSITVQGASNRASGRLTYIDATVGSTGNTFVTGSTRGDMSWLSSSDGLTSIDNKWVYRPYATDETILHSKTVTGAQLELTTQIDGLDSGTYEVWVFFWDSSQSNNGWNVATSLTSGAATTYSFDGAGDTTGTVLASTLEFNNTPMLTQSVRSMYGVSLGWVTVTNEAAIKVYIDALLPGSADRTWYDGVAYAAVAPVPTIYSSDIVDDRNGADVTLGNGVVYTITFSEDMDADTVTAADFANDGSASVTIGSVVELSNGVFEVQVTPDSVGTLRLKLSSGADLTSATGVPLDTDSDILDDTTINVLAALSPFEEWAGEGSQPDHDSNQDGIPDIVAWALGAESPDHQSNDLLPSADSTSDPDFYIYTYRRSDAAHNDPNTTIDLRYCSDLQSWNTAVHDDSDVIISVNDDHYAPGVDQVQVKLRKTMAVDDRLFVQLRVLPSPPE
ncbi:Calx-beta domain-containing protein [Coraliomargarita sinensis]|nr:Calx-beta domain-containing protein [Coraliomargarita sinensis]